MIKRVFTLFTFILTSYLCFSQNVTVSGKVTDANGKSLPGAIVVEKGTNNAVKTGMDGSYSLSVPENRVPTSVMIRLVGFGSSEVAVDGSSSDVNFSPSLGSQTRSLNEVVVSASKKSEKILNSPASVSVLSEARIQQNTSLSVVDNLRKVAAVDMMPTGLVSNNVVVRGFNNIFSGATMFMVDNRLASVPSLRVNAFQLVPTSNVDVRSMEVVRGPASALYGPFASNGVLAVYTKSPLDMENRMEVTLGLTTGIRSGDEASKWNPTPDNSIERLGIINPEIRIAGKLSKTVGLKVSGNLLKATDYAFYDEREPNGKTVRFGNQSGGNPWASDGSAPLVFNRDFSIKKISGEAKVDWRPAPQTELNFSTGYASNTNVELTGLGGAQAVGWTSNYFQTQFKKDRFYAQYYINSTNSGNTYLIPQSSTQSTFTYLKETSNLQSLQLQHSSKAFDNKLGLVYGYDMFMTRPSGNVYGRFDGGNANINQYGGYLQGDYKFNKQWSTTLAARMDYQDAIDEWMFSPRAALVYKPKENHTFRATYNRSFASPTALNFFLDLNNGGITGTSNSIRAFGNRGMTYNLGADGLPSLTNNIPNSTNLATNPASYTQLATNPLAIAGVKNGLKQVLIGQFMAAGAPASSANSSATLLLNGINPNSLAPVDAVTGKKVDVNTITDKQSVGSTITQTAEVGYKGFLMDKLSIGIDLYYSRINNFISPLTNVAYQVALDPEYYSNAATQAQMIANINAAGPFKAALLGGLTGLTDPSAIASLSNADIVKAYTTALIRAGAVANAGTIAPDNTGTGNDVVLTYLNLGTVDLAGMDLSFNYAATKDFNIEGAFSHVNKDRIPLQGAADGFVSLNAPKFKSALNLSHKLPIDNNGVTLSAGWRWMDKFDANSGVYVGRVNAMNMLDLGLSWRPSNSQNTIVSLSMNNVLDHRHQFFPLTSAMGRVTMLKLLHTFGVK